MGIKTRQKPNQIDTPNINHEEAGIVKHIAEIRLLVFPKTHIEVALVQVLFVTSLITKSLHQNRSSFKPIFCPLSPRLKPRPRLRFSYPSVGTSQLDVDDVILQIRLNFFVCSNSRTNAKVHYRQAEQLQILSQKYQLILTQSVFFYLLRETVCNFKRTKTSYRRKDKGRDGSDKKTRRKT